MRTMLKKIVTICTAAVLTASAVSLSGCGYEFTPLDGDYSSGTVSSNGGFVVEKGEYLYFINGVETYTSDNAYGTPVKGALMRIAKDEVTKGGEAETVVPSLMVAGDYTSGIFLYGDRVYYATPNNIKNTSGTIENDYLDFKSAKLDGSDIQSYFNLSDNATVYRYTEVDGTVYLIYEQDSELHSYNTATETDTLLAKNIVEYVVDSSDKTNPYIYYTMTVTLDIDVTDGALEREYNQVYRVRADATEAPYEYAYDEKFLEENDGEVPYLNLGTIVLDGIGALYQDSPTQFTHDLKEGVTPLSAAGYTYTLQSYANGGLYFTRSDLATTSTTGESGWLYYLSEEKLGAGWNSVSGNATENFTAIAQNTTYASTSAIFYLENGTHHYLYVSDSNMFRADVRTDNSGLSDVTLIARDVSGATLCFIDNTSDEIYHYVYYTNSGTVERAVYNGTAEDYKTLGYEDNAPYRPVQVLAVSHASSWYPYEVIDGVLYFADAESIGSSAYNYIACVDLNGADGKLMDNTEIEALNDKYESIMGGDDTDGYLTELTNDDRGLLSTALKYYFYTGETEQFDKNIQEAIDAGKKPTYLYSKQDQDDFKAFTSGEGDAMKFVDENGVSYFSRSYFIKPLGVKNEADTEAIADYWTTALANYAQEEPTETLPTWAWVLIGVGIGVLVVGIGLAVFFVLRARKNRFADEEEEEKMFVDTTDDRSVDVYADEESAEEPAPAQETASEETDGASEEEDR